MAKVLFSYTNYKAYLQDRIRSEPNKGHGYRRKMADAMNCQLSYVSHVLGGDRNLNVEQAEGLTRFLGLTADEREYFIWLVEHERSATPGAREFFTQLLDRKRDEFFQDQVAVESATKLDDSIKATYFGSYLYAAVQSLVMIEAFLTPQTIADRLGIELEVAAKVTGFLKQHGLIRDDRGRLTPTAKSIFIDRESPFILQHHTNWRMRALQSVARGRKSDQHLSFVLTISEKDAKLIRQKIAELVEVVTKTAQASREEKVTVANFDFFELV